MIRSHQWSHCYHTLMMKALLAPKAGYLLVTEFSKENIANKPKEEQPKLVDSKVDDAKRKLLIVDDYYNMNKFNESSRLSQNRAEFDDDTSHRA